ncbi:uncharacterized protein LAESUDRAFT_794475 [Laetiporus sulphureus 93-53]|uniref:Uncharacterized protein n=1 Tax=Laetiporus sulphureus 93-53 TaxID=1314785 RepID=A0A165C473_9APHY|nr:uncharacterized protein LAESUDRAFT_794475 [Laetiporus sulphureus 93-53]KZT02175.1 hypothetical protein LAESUDRAFT_794475 [Laetiporus sulphureus 93-53]
MPSAPSKPGSHSCRSRKANPLHSSSSGSSRWRCRTTGSRLRCQLRRRIASFLLSTEHPILLFRYLSYYHLRSTRRTTCLRGALMALLWATGRSRRRTTMCSRALSAGTLCRSRTTRSRSRTR